MQGATGANTAKDEPDKPTPAAQVEMWYYASMAGLLALGGAYYYFSLRKPR